VVEGGAEGEEEGAFALRVRQERFLAIVVVLMLSMAVKVCGGRGCYCRFDARPCRSLGLLLLPFGRDHPKKDGRVL